jgi:hypothetical protein
MRDIELLREQARQTAYQIHVGFCEFRRMQKQP